MRLVKLDAVDSTNTFLKSLCRESDPENFTVVTAEKQTAGRGQMGTQWVSEPSKNLTVSVLIREVVHQPDSVFVLNAAVAVAIAHALHNLSVPDIAIKWPNDIMSGNRKIGGILIENVMRGEKVWSVVGLGLNVNQTHFGDFPKAGSMALATGKTFDRDAVLEAVVGSIGTLLPAIENPDTIWQRYHEWLYRKDIVSVFAAHGKTFNGIIRGVNPLGELLLDTDDGHHHFRLKEVEMHY